MQLRLVIAALHRHRLATALIALEIALACAVLANACFLVSNRLSAMLIDSGVDESSLGFIRLEGVSPKESADLNARMLRGLGSIPTVQSVHVVNSVPFGGHPINSGITLDRAGKRFGGVVEFYEGDSGTPKAMGLQLVAGHMPTVDDYQPIKTVFPSDSNVLITRSLAEHLWPGENPLGKEFWLQAVHFRVIGLLSHLAIQEYNEEGQRGAEWTAFIPVQPGSGLSGRYLIRAQAQTLSRVMVKARAVAAKIAPDTVLDEDNSQTISYLRHRFFQTDRAMAGLLIGVVVAMLGVTAFGIVGLASFWVAQRSQQIGIRRALGATRGDILGYFQAENFLIVTLGIAAGAVLAVGINLMLMRYFSIARLPLWYLPLGALVLWLLGQLAVLAPALRAAAVPPVVATRSV